MILMTDWVSLRDAYGSATELPSLLSAMTPESGTPIWNELWSRLCHQGTVYSASYAALPTLAATAAAWAAADRLEPLLLASGIVAAIDTREDRDRALREHGQSIAQLGSLTRESLNSGAWERVERLYLLRAIRAFDADLVWGRHLAEISDGELEGRCPECSTELSIAIGRFGCFVTTEEWLPKSLPSTREAIRPAAEGREPAERELLTYVPLDDPKLRIWLLHAFGTSTCPECRQSFTVATAIAAAQC